MGSRWQDKLVLITGASAGIGRAAVEEFVREGARIIAVARSEDRLRELARSFNEGRVIPLAADVSDAGSMQLMASKVLETGIPDVIVAKAAMATAMKTTTMRSVPCSPRLFCGCLLMLLLRGP